MDASKAPATKRAYRGDWEKFTNWTQEQKVDALPATGATVANYITYLAESGRAASTISRALTSIAQAHKTLDLASPTSSPEVANVYKGIKRTKGVAQRRAKPLVIAELKRICDRMRPSLLGRRDKAMMLLGWAGALRRSELVALNLDDIGFDKSGPGVELPDDIAAKTSAKYIEGYERLTGKKFNP